MTLLRSFALFVRGSRVPSVARLGGVGVVGAAALLLQCTSFPAISQGTCGNAVVDPGEDCDGFARGDGTSCGAAGAAGACRFTCSHDPNAAVCPSGWGCGVDGVCREPAGTFARRPEAIVAGAWRVALADFDGDHRLDVLTRALVDARGFSKLRTHYFDSSFALVSTGLLPTKVGSPTTRDLDGDGIADLAFTLNAVDATLSGTINGAIGVLLGQRDRSFEPVAYPTFVFPNARAKMYPIGGFPNSPQRVVVFSEQGGHAALLHPDVVSGAAGLMISVPDGPDALSGEAISGNVIESTPCDELVWAYENAKSVSVFSTCKADPSGWVWNDAGTPVTIALPDGATVDGGVRIIDVDVDGHRDIIIGASQHAYVAYGDGMGGFTPITQQFSVPIYLSQGATVPTDYPIPMPLAIGDVSGDGKPDYVTSTYVLTSFKGDPLHGYGLAFYKSSGAWTSVAIGDLDGNGLPDIVAGSSADLDIDFLNGTGTAYVNPFTIPTTGTPSAFAIGDVDGDLVQDLVFASSTPNAEDELAIVFGSFGATPGAPQLVGRFGKITETATFNPGGALDSIGVISYSTDPKDTAVRIALLAGTGDRQPLAPFQLDVPQSTQGVPINIVAGSFAKDSNVDLVALAGDIPTTSRSALTTFRMWIAPASGPAEYQTSTPTDPLATTLHPFGGTSSAVGAAAQMASGDIDGDGVSDVVAVMPFTKDDATSAIVVSKSAPDGKGGWKLSVGNPITLDFPISLDGSIAIADVDGDGPPDLVLIGGSATTRRLVVMWNDGAGGFSEANATTINDAGEQPFDFGFVRTNAAARPAIVYVTHSSLVVASLADRTTITRTTLDATLNYGTGVAAGDIDGDGVDDIAVADTPSLVLYRGQPALE